MSLRPSPWPTIAGILASILIIILATIAFHLADGDLIISGQSTCQQ